MATEVGSAYVSLIPSARGFGARMQSELGGEIGRAGDRMGDQYGDRFSRSASSGLKSRGKAIFGSLARGGALAAAAAGVAVAKVIGGSISEARDAQVVGARTENVIRKMGGAANVSASQVAELAEQISNKTAIDDEAIQAGQNLLLTFGNVRNEAGKGNDVFSQTSQLMVDMSVAMGTDAKSAALQLGKALNDPTKGVSALTRSGVSFTQQQKDQIAALQESGDILGAQKIILSEVEKQFGGAGAAMSTPADRAKVAWGNFQEEIGTAILPLVDKILTGLANGLPKVIDVAKQLSKTIGPVITDVVGVVRSLFSSFTEGEGDMGKTVAMLRTSFADIKQIVSSAVELITAIWNSAIGQNMLKVARSTFVAIRNVIAGALQVIKGVLDVVMGLIQGDWSRVWDGIKGIVSGVWKIISSIVRHGITVLKAIVSNVMTIVRGIFARAWDGIKTLTGNAISALVRLVKRLPGLWIAGLRVIGGLLRDLFSQAFSTARDAVSRGAQAIVDAVRSIPGRLRDLGGMFLEAGKAIIGKFVDGLRGAGGLVSDIAGNVWDAVSGMINSAIDKINSALEFKIGLPGPDIHVNPPNIPHVASGGRATGATLAIIGEGAEPETVLPDSLLLKLVDSVATRARGGTVGQLTITNWREGTGYFRILADDSVRDDRAFRRDLGAMHA